MDSDLRHPVAFLAIAVPRPVLPCRAMLERFPFLSFVFRLDSADGLRSIFIASASLAVYFYTPYYLALVCALPSLETTCLRLRLHQDAIRSEGFRA